jgi:hypothetical protein
LYAVGEIFLVVIGILIALQVNNWNENRKNRHYEVMALNEMKKAIIADLDHFENHHLKNRMTKKKDANAFFDRILMKQEVNMDSIDHYFIWLKVSSSFNYNKGPYEGIKSAGLDRISNDSIRNKMTHVYDFFMPWHEELFEWSVDGLDKKVAKYDDYLHDHPEIFTVNDQVEISRNPKDLDFATDPKFLDFYRQSKSTTFWMEREFRTVVKELRILLDLINVELKTE